MGGQAQPRVQRKEGAMQPGVLFCALCMQLERAAFLPWEAGTGCRASMPGHRTTAGKTGDGSHGGHAKKYPGNGNRYRGKLLSYLNDMAMS